MGGLLLHGHLLLTELSEDTNVADAQEYVGDMRQLALAGGDGSPEDEPLTLVSLPRGWLRLRSISLNALFQINPLITPIKRGISTQKLHLP